MDNEAATTRRQQEALQRALRLQRSLHAAVDNLREAMIGDFTLGDVQSAPPSAWAARDPRLMRSLEKCMELRRSLSEAQYRADAVDRVVHVLRRGTKGVVLA